MAATFDFNDYFADISAEAYMLSPQIHVRTQQCLSFTYFIRDNLMVSKVDGEKTNVLADMHIYGGHVFHKALLDLPVGRYHVMWKTNYDARATNNKYFKYDSYISYWAIIDNVTVHDESCADLGKAQYFLNNLSSAR